MIVCWLSEREQRKEEPLPELYFQMGKILPFKVVNSQFFIHPEAWSVFLQSVQERIVKCIAGSQLNDALGRRKCCEEIQRIIMTISFPKEWLPELDESLDNLNVPDHIYAYGTQITYNIHGPFFHDRKQHGYQFYDISKDQVSQIIKALWAGVFTEELVVQYKQNPEAVFSLRPSLQVERFVKPNKSGQVSVGEFIQIRANFGHYLDTHMADLFVVPLPTNTVTKKQVPKKITCGGVVANRQLGAITVPLHMQDTESLEAKEIFALANLCRDLRSALKTLQTFDWIMNGRSVFVTNLIERTKTELPSQQSVVQEQQPEQHEMPTETEFEQKYGAEETEVIENVGLEASQEEVLPILQEQESQPEIAETIQSIEPSVEVSSPESVANSDNNNWNDNANTNMPVTEDAPQQSIEEAPVASEAPAYNEQNEEAVFVTEQNSVEKPLVIQRLHAILDELKEEHPDYDRFLDDLKDKILQQHAHLRDQNERF